MPRDIIFYSNINQFSATNFVNAINGWTESELQIRMDTNGGDPQSMWSMIAKLMEFVGRKVIKIDGRAYSGGCFFLCYCDYAECLDVSEAMVHRAAYSDYFESSPAFSEELKNSLIYTNTLLEKAFRAKVNVEAFEALPQMKGKKIADIFSLESRIDIYLSSQDMKAIGLVNKIVTITPGIQAELESNAQFGLDMPEQMAAKFTAKKEEPIQKNNIMTLAEFKAAHPALFAEITAHAKKEGVQEERDRVEGILVFNKIAPEICVEAIASGKNLSQKQTNEIMLKQMSSKGLEDLKTESAAAVQTDEKKIPAEKKSDADKKQAEIDAFEKETLEALGVKS